MDFEFVLTEIEVLSDYELVCRQTRGRDWFFPFLSGIFNLAVELRRRGVLAKAARKLAKKRGLRFDRHTNPVKVLIDASSHADNKTRSRWSRAVQYALDYRDERGPAKSMTPLFDRFGGVSGCASKIAKPRNIRKSKKEREGLRDWH